MNGLIFNREEFQHPADGWYMVEPKGEHPNEQSGITQVIDVHAAQSIVNRFSVEADKPGFAGMLIDHEHFKHDTSKETTAYGWLIALQNRGDGIYGKIRWTKTGQQAVDGGDYRYFSTEYDPSDVKVLNSDSPKRVRPLRLDGLTLTNAPNNTSGKPITNRRPTESQDMRICNAHDVMERAYAIRADNPKVSLPTCVQMAQRELKLQEDAANATIANRAGRGLADQDILVLRRAIEIVEQKPGITLPAAVGMAQEELRETIAPGSPEHLANSQAIAARGEQLIRQSPGTVRPHQAVRLAENEMDQAAARVVSNRARSIMAANPRVSSHSAFSRAERECGTDERMKKITNRANQLRKESPAMPFATCYNQASLEFPETE